MNEAEVIDEVANDLGLDVYHLYPDVGSRHLIPETVISGICTALILEFLKPFFDLNRLGKDARAKIEELIAKWRTKSDLEDYVKVAPPEKLLAASVNLAFPALMATGAAIEAPKVEAGRKNLEEALINFGLDPEVSRQHADRISHLIIERITRKN